MKYVIAIILAAVSLAGCVSVPNGSETAPVTASDFNQAIVQSKDEQLPLNLVRLRYRDTTQFLQITNVSETQSFGASAGATTRVSPFGDVFSDLGLAGSAEYTRRPVISMSPMNDAEFATAMLTPLGTSDLALLARSGWSIERILLCCVERFGDLSNSPRASGPTPDEVPDNSEFRAFAAEIRALQRDENLTLLFDGDEASLLFFNEALQEAPALAARLGIEAVNDRLPLRLLTEVDEARAPVQTRSILGASYALSHAVDVPAEHRAAGLVTMAHPLSPDTPDWESYLNGFFSGL